jgi:hypothetical protein
MEYWSYLLVAIGIVYVKSYIGWRQDEIQVQQNS